jgi:hypothetical protein
LKRKQKLEEISNLIDEAIYNYSHNQDESGKINLTGAKAELEAFKNSLPKKW